MTLTLLGCTWIVLLLAQGRNFPLGTPTRLSTRAIRCTVQGALFRYHSSQSVEVITFITERIEKFMEIYLIFLAVSKIFYIAYPRMYRVTIKEIDTFNVM
jgi:hypothetical protein